MLSLDDRTGNALTTIGLFAAVAGLAYAARGTLVVLVLALLVAYLLEPAIGWVQGRLPSHSRMTAIAVVYAIGIAVLVGTGYTIAPAAARQMQRLRAALPELRARLAKSPVPGDQGAAIAGPVERAAQTVVASAGQAGLLLAVPIVAVLFLKNRQELIDGTVDLFAQKRDRANVRRTVEEIDTMLGEYMRAQSATAALSVVFYSGSMALLKFPYPLALGLLGGALEFVPVAGWIVAAAAILTAGWLAHANLIAMAVLIVIWRVAQNVVISPLILGDRLQMDPITVFIALMAGGQIGGLLGVVLSVPAAAVLRILWLQRSSRQNSAAA